MGRKCPRVPKRTGFTLIELLVVIGIVALLMALLFPVFSRVREDGRQAACLNSERQLGTAFLLYTQENNEVVPPVGSGWAGQIYPYVKSVGVYHCPDDATAAQPPYFPVSYGLNGNLLQIVQQAHGLALLPRSMKEVSTKTVLLFEVSHVTAQVTVPDEGWDSREGIAPVGTSVTGAGGDGNARPDLSLAGTFENGNTFDIEEDARYATGVMATGVLNRASGRAGLYDGDGRHHGGANFAFSDAHVKWLRPEQVSTGSTAVTPSSEPWYGVGQPWSAAGSENSKFAATFSTE